MTNNCLW